MVQRLSMDPDSPTAAKDCFDGRFSIIRHLSLLMLSRTDLASSFDHR